MEARILTGVTANLAKNGFQTRVVESAPNARTPALEMIAPGAAVGGIGGSVTIRQLELIEALRERGHEVYDHGEEGLSSEEIRTIKLKQILSPSGRLIVEAAVKTAS